MATGIVIVEYDPEWPLQAAAEARVLAAAIPAFVAVEHIGSTAVPGLAGTPVIDLMPLVATAAHLDQCLVPLLGLGYDYLPQHEPQLPGTRFYRKHSQVGPAFHLHVTVRDGAAYRDCLGFRDTLLSDPGLSTAYERVKREAASGADREAYAAARASFVRDVLTQGAEPRG